MIWFHDISFGRFIYVSIRIRQACVILQQIAVNQNSSLLLLVLENSGESANVRLNFDRELIAITQELLGVFANTNTSRSTGQNDGASRQSRTLRAEADESGDVEDEVVDTAVLHDLTVLAALDVQLTRVRDQL